jgi:hypothetical protein
LQLKDPKQLCDRKGQCGACVDHESCCPLASASGTLRSRW